MRKVCFLIYNWSHTGGTERVSTLIANELSMRGVDIHFLSLWGNGFPNFRLNENVSGNQLADVNKKEKFSKIAIYGRLRSYVNNNNITHLVIVESMVALIGLPALFLSGCKTIVWEHFNYSIDLGRKARGYARKLSTILADTIVVLTNRDRELWVNMGSVEPSKIAVISNPISSIEEEIENSDRASYKTIIAVGRLTHQKGFDLLIESAASVMEKYESWRLLIIGGGEDEKLLRTQIKEKRMEHQIQLIPNTKSISEYYRSASFLVMSSRFEGLPMVLLESLSFALPIVSFDCLTGPSEIIDHGVNGLLAENGDIADLRVQIETLITDSSMLNNMSIQALKKAQHFRMEKIIQQWLKVFDNTAS